MHCLIVWAHPDPDSYSAAVLDTVTRTLTSRGHTLTCLDLYAMGFDPVLSAAEKATYLPQTSVNIANLQPHVDALRKADALIVVYPTWMYGPPAILKGWLDRVMLPGVAFGLGGGKFRPIVGKLHHIRHFVGITTSGSPWWWLRVIGDPGRSLFMKGLRPLFGARCKATWLQLHSMNHQDDAGRRRFLQRVERQLQGLKP